MLRGRESRTLRQDQIDRLEKFRRASHDGAPHGYTLPQLRLAIGAQFHWSTLKRALLGRPVWVLYHAYIVEWIDRYLPAKPLRDRKMPAAGDREDTEVDDLVAGYDGRSSGQEAGEDDAEGRETHERNKQKEKASATRIVRGSR